MSRKGSKRRVGVASAFLIALTLLFPVTGVGVASAAHEPNGAASCMGIEHAAISPPGTSDEEPGGSRQFVAEVKEIAHGLGVPVGVLMRFIAALHSGSHEACDAELGG